MKEDGGERKGGEIRRKLGTRKITTGLLVVERYHEPCPRHCLTEHRYYTCFLI
jgi:hypothetical protein